MSVVKSKRSIPSQKEFLEVDKMVRYTLNITSNENVFLPCYRGLTDEIVRAAISIYSKCFEAYNVRVYDNEFYGTSVSMRNSFQREAILECKNLLNLINVAYRIYHLRGHRVKYWGSLVIDARESLTKWRKRDIEKYRNR